MYETKANSVTCYFVSKGIDLKRNSIVRYWKDGSMKELLLIV